MPGTASETEEGSEAQHEDETQNRDHGTGASSNFDLSSQ